MFSLQKLFGQEDTFFTKLIASAKEAQACSHLLREVLKDPTLPGPVQEIKVHRRKCKAISEEISELVVSTFVTSLDREDIEALASALYTISKPIEKFADRFLLGQNFLHEIKFEQQARIIEGAVDIVVKMIEGIRKHNNLEYIRSLNAQLQQAEADADALENNLLQELYVNRSTSVRVVIIKDLYELLERAVDRCRDAGNVVTHIALKNS